MGDNFILSLNDIDLLSSVKDHYSILYEEFKAMNTKDLPQDFYFDPFDMQGLMPELSFLPTTMIKNAGDSVEVIMINDMLDNYYPKSLEQHDLVSSIRKGLILSHTELKPEWLMYSKPYKGYAEDFSVYKISLKHSSVQNVLSEAFSFQKEIEDKLKWLCTQDLTGSCKELIIPGGKECCYNKIDSSGITHSWYLKDDNETDEEENTESE